MKKYLVVLVAVFGLLSLQHVNAQTFQKGDVVAYAGLGLGSTFNLFGAGLGLPIGGGVEYGITDAIGVGGEVGFSAGGDITAFFIGPKGYYHFNDLLNLSVEELDLYAGVSILYRSVSFDSGLIGIGSISNGIRPGLFIGGRYYFSDSFAGFAELGNSYAWFKLGVALKF